MAERIALGMIGCGFFAQNHLHAWQDLQSDGVDIVAVCDVDPERAGRRPKSSAYPAGTPMPP